MENFRYQPLIDWLRKKKLEQIDEKIKKEGSLNEDDYGRVVPPEKAWKPIPNHPDGHFYGLDGWCTNFVSLMQNHPVYVDPHDAFAGRWMYFMSRMTPKWRPDIPYAELQKGIDKYNLICGIGDDAHFAPDFEMGLSLGWGGLLEKIEHYRKLHEEDTEKCHFYDCHRQAIEAIQTWIKHHIEAIEQMIEKESDTGLRNNLKDMAQVNRNILSGVPKTLREACQWIIWYHLASRTYNRDGAGGQIDTLLQPYYERDLEAGIVDRDTVIYYLACFLINDPVYWQLGGPDANGNDQTSEISFLILEAADRLNTSLNITIRVHDKLNEKLMQKAVGYLLKNKNAWPRFSGDKALVEGFIRNGFDEKLARKRIAVGCNWMSLPGLEYTMNDLVKVNMAKVFDVALHDMRNGNNEFSTVQLSRIFDKHLKKAVHTAAEGIRFHLKNQKYNEPELILNLLSHGPIEKGLDASNGGAMYYNLAIDGAGLAIVADSFAAIEQRIEKEKKINWKELFELLDSNFENPDGERKRLLLKNSEKYGQGDTAGDRWAKKIAETFTQYVRDETEPELNRIFIPGFFSWANTIELGIAVGATPNGRKKGEPISHGANPCPGFAPDGASLLLAKSIASVQPGYGNTAPMQWEVDVTSMGEKAAAFIEAVVKTHFNLGGTLINVNIMDKQKVLDAYKDPSLYPDLVVRCTGFTAYFSMLTPDFRKLVVDRLCDN
ncbi:pyruvate formate lyase family protein [Coprobacter tertius]|uniref:Formate acetyltransferase n=1 Tax=Coprobacter tertius TaxID=2944915 RepID=A0ABT1MDJ6_9BACT|nr:pyruvate formate lyase family protein [Coprobacter tertius]MCP9610707.1 formate acetyltransferase [Coprobacter tertius]